MNMLYYGGFFFFFGITMDLSPNYLKTEDDGLSKLRKFDINVSQEDWVCINKYDRKLAQTSKCATPEDNKNIAQSTKQSLWWDSMYLPCVRNKA